MKNKKSIENIVRDLATTLKVREYVNPHKPEATKDCNILNEIVLEQIKYLEHTNILLTKKPINTKVLISVNKKVIKGLRSIIN